MPNIGVEMAGVSPDLLWQLVKKNNKFLVKRNGNGSASMQFSSEPNNLYNLNSFKYSGILLVNVILPKSFCIFCETSCIDAN